MRVVIIGAGGHGRVVLDILQANQSHVIVGFVDNDPDMLGQFIDGVPVIGTIDLLPALREQYAVEGAIVAIGNNDVRHQIATQVSGQGVQLINAIHPSALISPTAQLGVDVVVAAGVIIGAYAQIGDNAIINTGAIVEHENKISANVHISPGVCLAGRVHIGNGAHVGIGATIIQNITVGERAVIGAGAVVVSNIPANCTAVGVPARIIKMQETEEK